MPLPCHFIAFVGLPFITCDLPGQSLSFDVCVALGRLKAAMQPHLFTTDLLNRGLVRIHKPKSKRKLQVCGTVSILILKFLTRLWQPLPGATRSQHRLASILDTLESCEVEFKKNNIGSLSRFILTLKFLTR